jgi:hypothetical protein
MGGNTPVGAADPGLEKASRSTRRSPASSGNRRQETAPTARRHGPSTRWARSGRGRNPLKRETWTWQQDETSLQGSARSKPSRACETLRAEHRWAWDAHRTWTRKARVAKRFETPWKAPGSHSGPTQARRTLEESQAHERMTRFLIEAEDGTEGRPPRSARNGEASVGWT